MKLTQADYLTHKRSAKLRKICINLAGVTWKVMQGKLDAGALVLWDYLMDELREMGITAEMNAGFAEAAYSDPLFAAEYIAGQWLSLAERTNNRALLAQASDMTEDRAITMVDPAYHVWRYTLEWFGVQEEEMP